MELPDAKDVSALLQLITPGIIVTAIRARAVTGIAPELKDKVLEFGVISVVYGALVGPLFHESRGVTLSTTWWVLFYSVLLPALIGVLLAYVSGYQLLYKAADKVRLPLAHHLPTAWDYTFRALPAGTFILVTLTDGTTVPGKMSKNSFASSTKDERDLLIEELWEIDGNGDWSQVEPARNPIGRGVLTMTNKPKPRPKSQNEGYQPVQKGWARKVQGGFKPSGNVIANPPKGGSGVKPPPATLKK